MEIGCVSLKCEVDCGCLAKGLPLLCEVVFVLPLVKGCIRLREELCTPGCIALNPQWRFPVWESCVDKLVDWKSFCVKAGT